MLFLSVVASVVVVVDQYLFAPWFCAGVEGTDRQEDREEGDQEPKIREAGPGGHCGAAHVWGHMCGEFQGLPADGKVHPQRRR